MEIGSFYCINDVFTRQECERIIFSMKSEVKKSTVVNGEDGIRESESIMIPRNDDSEWIYERLLKLTHEMNQSKFKFNIDHNCILGIQFTKYGEGDYYNWHMDTGPTPTTCCRKLSITVQLSDPSSYKGGELQLGLIDKNASTACLNQGSVTIFSSIIRHRVTEVTKGERYSLVAWVTGFPFY